MNQNAQQSRLRGDPASRYPMSNIFVHKYSYMNGFMSLMNNIFRIQVLVIYVFLYVIVWIFTIEFVKKKKLEVLESKKAKV